MTETRAELDGIPVLMLTPSGSGDPGAVVLWMSHLGGSAEQTRPMLQRFVNAGHPAVSFDAVGHGARGSEDPWEFAASVLGSFRRRMWPILGQSTLEAMRVLTWAREETGSTSPVLAGGVSMGGDVAVALAGIDSRVARVAAVGSTPDWTRPGMRELEDPGSIIDQGRADPFAAWFADQLDPVRHLERYLRDVAITFEHGADDHHIPIENAAAFAAALDREAAGAGRPRGEVRVQSWPALDHLAVTTGEGPLNAAVDWLLRADHDQRDTYP